VIVDGVRDAAVVAEHVLGRPFGCACCPKTTDAVEATSVIR
jgi:hypothetical protein